MAQIKRTSATSPQRNYFEDHWIEHSSSRVSGPKLLAASAFLSPILSDNYLNGLAVLDIGCGDGVHLSLLSDRFPRALLTGIDVSHSALKTCASKVPLAQFLQSSAKALPFNDEAFDIIISYGVLGYLDSISEAVAEMLRVVRRGGLVGIWIYPVSDGLIWSIGKGLRQSFSSLPTRVRSWFANCLVPFLPLLPTTSRISLANSTWRECKEIILVNLAPPNLHFYTHGQLVAALTTADIHYERLKSESGDTNGYWLRRV